MKTVKLLKSYWRELVCALSAYGAIVCYWYAMLYMRHRILLPVFLFSALICAIIFLRVFRYLWRKKWSKKAEAAFLKLYSKVAARVFGFLEKMGVKLNKKHNDLGGKSSITFNFAKPTSRQKKPKRHQKWKHMQNGREKLGFLYRALIHGKLKKGCRIYASDTPCEAEQRSENSEIESDVFKLYIGLRYTDGADPNGEQLEKMYSELTQKRA